MRRSSDSFTASEERPFGRLQARAVPAQLQTATLHLDRAVCRCRAKMLHRRRIAKGGSLGPRPEFRGIGRMDLSVVIPVKNEAPNIAPLVAEICAALDGLLAYEIVYVDDGSSDGTAEEVRRLAATSRQLRLVRHARSCGQSAAVR